MRVLIFVLLLSSSLAFAQKEIGCPNVDYPDWETSPYVLPFAVGETYRVELANCSSSYHNENYPDKFAYDFVMEIGTRQ